MPQSRFTTYFDRKYKAWCKRRGLKPENFREGVLADFAVGQAKLKARKTVKPVEG